MKLRILIIDDEECIRDTFRWHLEDQGHEVLTASEPLSCDIYQGGECCHQHPCADLLFVDYHMPRMNGLEFLEYLHQKGCKGLAAHRVLITGDSSAVDMEKVRELGCQLKEKPVNYEELDKIVQEVERQTDPKRKLNDLLESGNN
ncbi:MAG: response regulator [Desulfuromonadales bacterium]|nr:response regulator [Desulfuromonadales bacterium]